VCLIITRVQSPLLRRDDGTLSAATIIAWVHCSGIMAAG